MNDRLRRMFDPNHRPPFECGRNHGMSEELEVLKEVTRRLDRAKIAYMVTGSIATNLYTIPRMTRDIDLVVELSEKDLSQFIPLFDADYLGVEIPLSRGE